MKTLWRAGTGIADITALDEPVSMLGWGVPGNEVRGVTLPIHARAFVFEVPESGRRFAYVVSEIAFMAQAVRDRVLELLGDDPATSDLGEHEVCFAATHTHSAPGGYHHELFFNFNVPGYSESVHQTYVQGMLSAIRQAATSMVPANLRLATGEMPADRPVAFNRSWRAYNANPEVDRVNKSQRSHAVDRTMTWLRIEDADGRCIGGINWYAVHCTSVHADNKHVHADNKGYAAVFSEHAIREREGGDPVVAFAQGAAGDVSPNYRFVWSRLKSVGVDKDDDASARWNGRQQSDLAMTLDREARQADPLPADLHAQVRYLDFTSLPVSPQYVGGREGLHTGGACIGVGFMEGTSEGPGPLRFIRGANRAITSGIALWRWARREPDHPHGNMFIFLEAGKGGEGVAFHVFPVRDPIIPDFLHQGVPAVRTLHRRGLLGNKGWVPVVVPLHVFRLGPLAIVSLPGEPTTVAGRRMRRQALDALRSAGVSNVVVAGYGDSYAGYVTTPEEFRKQHYEGATNYFGQWALPAYQTALDDLLPNMRDCVWAQPGDLGAEPDRFDHDELEPRRFSV